MGYIVFRFAFEYHERVRQTNRLDIQLQGSQAFCQLIINVVCYYYRN